MRSAHAESGPRCFVGKCTSGAPWRCTSVVVRGNGVVSGRGVLDPRSLRPSNHAGTTFGRVRRGLTRACRSSAQGGVLPCHQPAGGAADPDPPSSHTRTLPARGLPCIARKARRRLTPARHSHGPTRATTALRARGRARHYRATVEIGFQRPTAVPSGRSTANSGGLARRSWSSAGFESR